MSVWLAAVLLTALCCAALYYAAARAPVNARAGSANTGPVALYRAQLGELERDIAAGNIAASDAEAARTELGRELLRQEAEAKGRQADGRRTSPLLALPLIAVVALGTYWALGQPGMPGLPANERPELQGREQLIAIVQVVEERLRANPEEIEGWRAIGPVYLNLGRYADAADAFRRIIALGDESADAKSNLAEALTGANGGVATGEALALLQSAAADPADRRAKYLLAVEAMRDGRMAEAKAQWEALIALGPLDASWMESAQQALAIVNAELAGGGQ